MVRLFSLALLGLATAVFVPLKERAPTPVAISDMTDVLQEATHTLRSLAEAYDPVVDQRRSLQGRGWLDLHPGYTTDFLGIIGGLAGDVLSIKSSILGLSGKGRGISFGDIKVIEGQLLACKLKLLDCILQIKGIPSHPRPSPCGSCVIPPIQSCSSKLAEIVGYVKTTITSCQALSGYSSQAGLLQSLYMNDLDATLSNFVSTCESIIPGISQGAYKLL